MKKVISLILAVTFFAVAAVPANADGYIFVPYNSYGYDEWGGAIHSSDGYIPESIISGDTANTVKFKNPTDIFVDNKGQIYVLNGQDNGIVILDQENNLLSNITHLYTKEGTEENLIEPTGIFVKNEKIYIADKGRKEVIICDHSGKIEFTLKKPKNTVFPQEKEFLPSKVLADYLDNVFVIVDGVYEGAVCYNKNHEFTEFYGSNTVVASASVILQRFWRKFMNETQRDYTAGIVPTEYTSFDIDKEGFIYTCTAVGSEKTNQLRKLNPLGNNVYEKKTYGDLETLYVKGKSKETSFVDVAINDDNVLYALDASMGRIFVYNGDGQEMFIFGGLSQQVGCFTQPVAIETYNDKLFVLDSKKNSLTTFVLSEYGSLTYKATLSYAKGNYVESKELWEQVLTLNENNSLAYIGIGKALYYQGDYSGAQKYFKLGGERAQESATFTIWRKSFMRTVLSVAIPGIIMMAAALLIAVKVSKRRRKK